MAFSDSERGALDTLAPDIDPREFGRLEAQVLALEREVQGLRSDVKELLALANKSSGGLWVGMSMVSLIGGVIGWLATQLWSR